MKHPDVEVKKRPADAVVKTFKYKESFDNQCRYRHAVDDHNNLRHAGISLEEMWKTRT